MDTPEPPGPQPASGRGRSPGSKLTQFQRGHPGRPKVPPPERVEGSFDRLGAMRHVLLNPPSTDRSEGEKACRVWLKKSPGPFMEVLDRLEREAEAAARVETAATEKALGSEQPLAPDESDREVEAAIVRLLERCAEAAELPRG